jgi:hypothetical protein
MGDTFGILHMGITAKQYLWECRSCGLYVTLQNWISGLPFQDNPNLLLVTDGTPSLLRNESSS